ncbi:DNA gyrase subunit A [Candidatus Woesearchaeota archaeon]|nr:DNA gyrase subunit A [Candidatus Woesearchaeota archaeon]
MAQEKSSSGGEPAGRQSVLPKEITDEMRESYIDYAMSVIVGRALPDVRDGLKPVHRKILFGMHDMGMTHAKPFKKSARIVGEVLGKYHPHGDTAVYETLVRLAQDFSMRYPLVQGQGNFGSVDGDNAAAMRYTEARLAKVAAEMLEDLDKDTVDFGPNFDGSLKEPLVLPSRLPNLLVNGTSGIAVGMATNIPPHNLIEVCDAVERVIDDPAVPLRDLIEVVKGPDFPTGAIISGRQGIVEAYTTGRGKVRVRAHIKEEESRGRNRLILTEIPYQVNKALLIEQIADLIRAKHIQGIADIRDESDRTGMRVVIELKKEASPDVVRNQLYTHSKCATTFGIIFIALVDGEPRVLTLKQLIEHFIAHRKRVVTRRTRFELAKAEERAHILAGLIIALGRIDDVVDLIRRSASVDEARTGLIGSFSLSEKQANAILEMRLSRLTGLERKKVADEHAALIREIALLKAVLASEKEVCRIIKEEMRGIKKAYGDARRTVIEEAEEEDLDIEDLIEEEDVVITISRAGYIKRIPLTAYRTQRRGGKGIVAAETKHDDFIEHIFIANTKSSILFFTDRGQVHWLKVYRVPEASRYAVGKAVVNLLELGKDEMVTAFIPVKEFDPKHYLLLATRKGIIKKTVLSAYSRPRRGGIRGIGLAPDDRLINALLTDGTMQVILATRKGMAVKFDERDARPVGRGSKGVKGITLKGDDAVVGMVYGDDTMTLLTVTENGYGKRTSIEDYRLINRGGIGVKNIQCTPRNGRVAAIMGVAETDELMFISKDGIIIRTASKDISTIGRNTQGVRLMKLASGDRVVGAAKVANGNGY